MILGIDEVGRGAWAGPMVVGAVVLGDAKIDGLDDSKKLTAKKRAHLAAEIKKQAVAIGIGWVSAATIDKIGLGPALKLAARRAVAQIDCDYDKVIIDGTIKLIDDPRVSTMPRADGLIAAVSAASIVAKVARDNYLARLDQVFDGYGFASHVGYGTSAHHSAIKTHGVLPIHRQSFAPIAALCYKVGPCSKTGKVQGTTGRIAEDAAAEYLVRKGHEIIARNWRTKLCEVDIISRYNDAIYFTEVKFRKSDQAGDGLEAITPQKEQQMRFAAEIWLTNQDLLGKIDVFLSVVALSGDPPTVVTYLDNIDGY
jgi:ribonuclease HII